MSSSMGRIIPYIMENNPNVWNHKPDLIWIDMAMRPSSTLFLT